MYGPGRRPLTYAASTESRKRSIRPLTWSASLPTDEASRTFHIVTQASAAVLRHHLDRFLPAQDAHQGRVAPGGGAFG